MSIGWVLGTHTMRMQGVGIEAQPVVACCWLHACLAAAHAEWHQHVAPWPVQQLVFDKQGCAVAMYTEPGCINWRNWCCEQSCLLRLEEVERQLKIQGSTRLNPAPVRVAPHSVIG